MKKTKAHRTRLHVSIDARLKSSVLKFLSSNRMRITELVVTALHSHWSETLPAIPPLPPKTRPSTQKAKKKASR